MANIPTFDQELSIVANCFVGGEWHKHSLCEVPVKYLKHVLVYYPHLVIEVERELELRAADAVFVRAFTPNKYGEYE